MFARFFKKSEPIGFISLVALLLVYILIHLFRGNYEVNTESLMELVGVFFLFSLFIFLLDSIIYKNQLTPNNYYTIYVFVVLIGLFPSVLVISKISISYFFILLAMRQIYSIQTNKKLLLELFDSGFYIGIAFLIYPATGFFIFFIWISYAFYIHIFSKDLFLPVLGFLAPLFLSFTYYFLTDNLASFKSITELNIFFDYRVFTRKALYIPLLIVSILCFWALVKLFSNRHLFGIKWNNSFNLVLFHLLVSLIIILTSGVAVEETILFLFFSVSIIAGNSISLIQKNWFKDTLLLVLLVLSFLTPFSMN